MAYPFSLAQAFKIVEGMPLATDAAGRTSDWISCKNAHKVFAVASITQGNAATILLSPLQATAVAGTGSKVFANAVSIWANLDTATSDALVKATDAVNYTTDAAVKNKIVVFEIDPAKMDTAGGFDCLAVSTGASNVANLTGLVFYILGRYNEGLAPSAIVD
jgi:hypothetical protein